MTKYRNVLDDFLAVTKALADENRVKALCLLQRGELCMCQIIELLGVAPSTVSKHMSILWQAGLVLRRKEGKWHYYRLADDSASPLVKGVIDLAISTLRDDRVIAGDLKRLSSVCKKSREDFCFHYDSEKKRC